MDDGSTTTTSSPRCEHDTDSGLVAELVDSLDELDSGADHDVDEALAAAIDNFRAEIAERTAAAAGAITVEIGEVGHTLAAGDEIVIGRRGDHRVDHPLVSRRHLEVRYRPRSLLVRDLGSANGSWVIRGDRRLAVTDDVVPLVPGDRVVTAGDVELLRVPGAR